MNKLKISQMKASPMELDLIHPLKDFNDPVTGTTGAIVTLVGYHSPEFQVAYDKFKASEKTDQDNITLAASMIIGWNDSFDDEFSQEAVINFLSPPENKWASDQIAAFIRDPLKFYKKK